MPSVQKKSNHSSSKSNFFGPERPFGRFEEPCPGHRLMEHFRRLNNQNRLSVTDSTMSINSTTSTETPSTVRAVTSGDQEDLSKSQEDLLANDNASVASGNR